MSDNRQAAVLGDSTGTATRYPKTRRVRFRFAESGAVNRYFAKDDIVFSHFVAMLSAAFPPGEESFIRSARRFSGEITDPVLKQRVAGFIGQESVHGQEHRRLNNKLSELGYSLWQDQDAFNERQIRLERPLSARTHLALTAAFEHYTAACRACALQPGGPVHTHEPRGVAPVQLACA